MDLVMWVASYHMGGYYPILGDLNKTKSGKIDPFFRFVFLLELAHQCLLLLLDWDLYHWIPWFSGTWAQTEIAPLGLWVCSLQMVDHGAS